MALIYKVLRIESQRAFVGRRIFSEGIGMARAAHPRTLSSLSPCSLSEWSEREKRISNGFISTGLELTACLQWSGLDPHCTAKAHHNSKKSSSAPRTLATRIGTTSTRTMHQHCINLDSRYKEKVIFDHKRNYTVQLPKIVALPS